MGTGPRSDDAATLVRDLVPDPTWLDRLVKLPVPAGSLGHTLHGRRKLLGGRTPLPGLAHHLHEAVKEVGFYTDQGGRVSGENRSVDSPHLPGDEHGRR